MAITYVGNGAIISNNNLVGTTGISPSPNGGTITDDFMIAISHRNQDDGTYDSAPSGWTELILNSTSAGQDMQTGIWYRKATSGSEATPTFTHSDATGEQWAAVIMTFRGVDTTTPFDVVYNNTNHFTALTNKATPNVDAFDPITTVTNNALVLAVEMVTHDDITSNADPSGYTSALRHYGGSFDHRQFQVWYKEVASAGSETPGAPAYTSNATAAESHQYTLALRLASNPIITSVKGGAVAVDTDLSVVIVGTDLPDGTGSSKYEIGSTAVYATATKVEIETNAFTSAVLSNVDLHETSTTNPIDDDITLLPQGTIVYLYATNDSGVVSDGFAFTLHDEGAAWAANLNTAIDHDVTSADVDGRVAVAIEVDSGTYTGGDSIKWRYSKNSGAYADITASSPNIKTKATSEFADGDDVPDLGLGSGNYVSNNNAAEETTGTFSTGDNISSGGRIIPEISYTVIKADLADNDTIDLRLYDVTGAKVFDAYTQTPRITITKTGGINPGLRTLTLTGVGL